MNKHVDFERSNKFLDLAVANILADNVSILIGNGNGTFGLATNFGVGDTPRFLVVNDFNKDSKLDLAVPNFGGRPFSIAVGDFDNK